MSQDKASKIMRYAELVLAVSRKEIEGGEIKPVKPTPSEVDAEIAYIRSELALSHDEIMGLAVRNLIEDSEC